MLFRSECSGSIWDLSNGRPGAWFYSENGEEQHVLVLARLALVRTAGPGPVRSVEEEAGGGGGGSALGPETFAWKWKHLFSGSSL